MQRRPLPLVPSSPDREPPRCRKPQMPNCDRPLSVWIRSEANVFTVDLPEGSALLLPAYWYHQVESFVDAEDTDVEDSCPLNVAINYWFSREEEAPPAPSYVHRKLRERLRIEC